jgi:hypothetical protein
MPAEKTGNGIVARRSCQALAMQKDNHENTKARNERALFRGGRQGQNRGVEADLEIDLFVEDFL